MNQLFISLVSHLRCTKQDESFVDATYIGLPSSSETTDSSSPLDQEIGAQPRGVILRCLRICFPAALSQPHSPSNPLLPFPSIPAADHVCWEFWRQVLACWLGVLRARRPGETSQAIGRRSDVPAAPRMPQVAHTTLF
eukprot:746431-Hanusia_phi.AAC.2